MKAGIIEAHETGIVTSGSCGNWRWERPSSPAILDAGWRERSSHGAERELELMALCDPRVREAMESDGITLHCFHVFSRADAG